MDISKVWIRNRYLSGIRGSVMAGAWMDIVMNW